MQKSDNPLGFYPDDMPDDPKYDIGPFKTLKAAIAAAIEHHFNKISDTNLPDWEDLRGGAPDATGELSSEEFIRRQRDDWEW